MSTRYLSSGFCVTRTSIRHYTDGKTEIKVPSEKWSEKWNLARNIMFGDGIIQTFSRPSWIWTTKGKSSFAKRHGDRLRSFAYSATAWHILPLFPDVIQNYSEDLYVSSMCGMHRYVQDAAKPVVTNRVNRSKRLFHYWDIRSFMRQIAVIKQL